MLTLVRTLHSQQEVKIFDLGLARLMPPSNDESSVGSMNDEYVMSRVGTKLYMAPEVRRKDPYSLPADVYSFGVVLWQLLCLSSPSDLYNSKKVDLLKSTSDKNRVEREFEVYRKQVEIDSALEWLPICPCWPEEMRNLVKSAMSFDPADRPSMAEVVAILNQYIDSASNSEL